MCPCPELEDLRKQEKRLLWHPVTLSETTTHPQSLRINKAPAFGSDDPEFMKRWEQILNKCFLDWEVLLIEKSKAECSKKLDAIKSLETKVHNLHKSDEVTQMEEKDDSTNNRATFFGPSPPTSMWKRKTRRGKLIIIMSSVLII